MYNNDMMLGSKNILPPYDSRQFLTEGEYMEGKTICFYGIPAYGHTCSNLYLVRRLDALGFRVVYYSTEMFHRDIEANGGRFRAYPVRQEELDLSDGQKILRLYRLILQYTEKMLPVLLQEAEKENPCAVIFESLAFWGRAVGQMLSLPAYSFYSIADMGKVGGEGFWAYAKGFAKIGCPFNKEIPESIKLRKKLEKHYKLEGLGLFPVLMNKGDYQLMGFSRRFQPGGEQLGKRYLFLGPLATHRQIREQNDFEYPQGKIIYVSLGTIFNQNRELAKALARQFGDISDWSVIIVDNQEWRSNGKPLTFPDNFIVRSFVNQKEILKRSSLFITAGGVNSIHEALYYGVPCLLYPQQGEQLLNARQFEKMGFGRILRNLKKLRWEAEQAMMLKRTWNEKWKKEMTMVCVDEALEILSHPQTSGTGKYRERSRGEK